MWGGQWIHQVLSLEGNLMDHQKEPGAPPELTRPISFLLVICKQQAPELEPTSAMPPLPQPPLAPTASLTPAQGTPSMDELIQQSQWSLQQQEQHLLALRQVCLHVLSVTLESPSSRSVGHPQASLSGLVPIVDANTWWLRYLPFLMSREGHYWPHLLGWFCCQIL